MSIIKNGLAIEFEIKDADLPTLPFIGDDEIEYYDTSTNKIFVTKVACEKNWRIKT